MLDFADAVNELEQLDRRIHSSLAERKLRDMSREECRREVRDIFVRSQGFDKIPIPEIKYQCVSESVVFNCRVQRLAGTGWDNCALASHLFLPLDSKPCPVVLCACGHGEDKMRYGMFGAALAQRGIACLVPDNIGQLERQPMGHKSETAPFDCGFSFVALLTTELLGNLEWLKKDDRFTLIGAAGNSGGGLLTMSLAALAPEGLSAIASTGYPSSFEWICRKRKRHCVCNLLPGVLGKIEHDELYSLFAPRPLRLMQGVSDNLMPLDVFKVTAAAVARTYKNMGKTENFASYNWKGPHSWCRESIEKIAEFFLEEFGVTYTPSPGDDELFEITDDTAFGKVYSSFPGWGVDTATLAYIIAGKEVPAKQPELWDIWSCNSQEEYPELYAYGKTEQIMAQWRCFLDGFK